MGINKVSTKAMVLFLTLALFRPMLYYLRETNRARVER